MRTVGIRELKNRLSEYLRAVAAGETVQVTDHGRVVAELGPPRSPDRGSIHPGLLELERKGLVRLATRPNDPSLYRPTGIKVPPGTTQELIDFIRGEDP